MQKNAVVINIYVDFCDSIFDRKGTKKMHKELYSMEQDDLLTAIYYYYSTEELPQQIQDTIDVTIFELQEGESDPNYIETTINDVVSTVDSHAFYRGFRACLDLMSGNAFKRITEGLEHDE